mmetsp:Transcript_42842/g.69473  ORF Transcript_42842/g.69473 Transcript_42842/m.69473 type:complete len:90 (+) Transcript_42842:476-745(+)
MISGFKSLAEIHQQSLYSHPIDCPSLHIWGSADAIVVPSRSRELAQAFVNPVVFENEGGGHFVPCKKDLLISFLRPFFDLKSNTTTRNS